jgi:hypothetical protein
MITGELEGPIVKINLLQQAAGFPSERISFPMHALEYSSSWIPETEQSTRRLLETQIRAVSLCLTSTVEIYVGFDFVAASRIPLRHHQHNFKILSCTESKAERVLGLARVRVEDNKVKLQHASNIGCCMWLVKKNLYPSGLQTHVRLELQLLDSLLPTHEDATSLQRFFKTLAQCTHTMYTRPTASTQVRLHRLPVAQALPQHCYAPRLLVIRPHGLYLNTVVRCDYSSPSRTGSTSTSPCAASTRLLAAAALHRLRRTPPRHRLLGVRLLRLLISTSKLVENGYYVINN